MKTIITLKEIPYNSREWQSAVELREKILRKPLGRDKNFKIMYCHARDSAVNFYSKNDYEN